ncbi:unnamed protein product [Arabis nemorensis]|uniref:GRF-type domain-containing protein n=1 Tax=Arabis nemorensis TaxID=586526 RepID=A0A565CJM6_9BRAS|nr:unnamed protein product [Arabis nemorensis]
MLFTSAASPLLLPILEGGCSLNRKKSGSAGSQMNWLPHILLSSRSKSHFRHRMGQYSYTQPSSSSIRSESSTARHRAGRTFCFPNSCYCGLVPVIKTSTTAENSGRRFFGCHNHADGLYHIFKWWNEAIMDEFEEMKLVVEQQADLISYFKSNESQVLHDCVDKPTIRYCLQKTDTELAQLKEMIIENRYRSVEVKNAMVACLIILFGDPLILLPIVGIFSFSPPRLHRRLKEKGNLSSLPPMVSPSSGNHLVHFDFNFDISQRFWLLMIMSDMEFPLRLYTKGQEPPPAKSIGYYAGDKNLFETLVQDGVLQPDELNELYYSKLGVFLQANLETPEVEVTDEMKAFWELLGVYLEMGQCINDLVAACGACQSWPRVDHMRLGYLCIYAGYIEDDFVNYPWGRVAFKNLLQSVKDKDLTKSSYVIEGFVQVLQVWVYWALPNFAKEFGDPTSVKSFVMKNTMVEMLPFWDAKVDNILKVAFDKGWNWKNSHWPGVGVKFYKCIK